MGTRLSPEETDNRTKPMIEIGGKRIREDFMGCCNWTLVALLIVLGFIIMETDASAYVDPGVGSFALQLIAASVVAIGFFVRKFWSRITSFFSQKGSNSDDGQGQ